MFGIERLWHQLVGWMSQKSHPEATMMNTFKAFKTVTTAAPELLGNVMAASAGGNAPLCCMSISSVQLY